MSELKTSQEAELESLKKEQEQQVTSQKNELEDLKGKYSEQIRELQENHAT